MLPLLLATALAAPNAAYHAREHDDRLVVQVHVPPVEARSLLTASELLSHHDDEYDAMQVRRISAPELDGLATGAVLRSWDGDEPVDCTVAGFLAEVPSTDRTELPADAAQRATFLAQLSCAEPVGGWLVAATSPPLRWLEQQPVAEAEAEARIDEALEGHATARAVFADARAEAGPRAIDRTRTVTRVATTDGDLLVEIGRLTTGEGMAVCGYDDMVVPYVAIVRASDPVQLVDFYAFDSDAHVSDLVDMDADGRPEVVVRESMGTRSRIIGHEGTRASAVTMWWSFCPC